MKLINADLFYDKLEKHGEWLFGPEYSELCDIQDMLKDEPGINPYEWISVADRLPDKETPIKWRERTGYNSARVLCVCRQKSGKVMVKEGYCEMWDGDYGPYWKIPGSIDSVTHWMPLPTPPTDNCN